jgi:hypothetical protein
MKSFKKTRTTTKVALCAGATALMALTPQTHAQSSVDALLNKLEQKGILTVDEAQNLKADNAKDSVTDFNKALNAKFPMPDWVTGYKFSGDFRGRVDNQSSDNAAIVDNLRLRYRVRVGLAVMMKDGLEAGFRLGSGDGGPLSNNQTMAGNGSKKALYVDTAYGKWTAINNGSWMVAGTIGKMNEPLDVSAMVIDPDYTPEGAALQSVYKLNDQQTFRFNGAAFVLDNLGGSTRDPFLYGGQAFWDSKISSHLGTTLGVSAFDIVNQGNLTHGYDGNTGNTIAGGTYADHYNPIIVDGSATYKLDSFPLYHGAFPIKVAAEYMNNPAANSSNEGWWAGFTLGKSGKQGNWDVSYRYQRLEANAWWDQIVDDDNVAALPTSPTAAALHGGTNVKGHLIKLNYSITDALTFTTTFYLNDLINNPVPGAKSSALHAMVDLMWKF